MTSMKLAMLVINTLRLVNGHGVLTWPPNRQQLGEECFKVKNCFQANRVVTKSHQDDFHGCCDDDCSYVLRLVVIGGGNGDDEEEEDEHTAFEMGHLYHFCAIRRR